MTTTVYVESDKAASEVMGLVQSAVSREMVSLELAIQAGKKRAAIFEQKYGVTSSYFMAEMAAEDLEEGDDEYVRWAGEIGLTQRLEEKLSRLKEINYRDQNLSHPD